MSANRWSVVETWGIKDDREDGPFLVLGGIVYEGKSLRETVARHNDEVIKLEDELASLRLRESTLRAEVEAWRKCRKEGYIRWHTNPSQCQKDCFMALGRAWNATDALSPAAAAEGGGKR